MGVFYENWIQGNKTATEDVKTEENFNLTSNCWPVEWRIAKFYRGIS